MEKDLIPVELVRRSWDLNDSTERDGKRSADGRRKVDVRHDLHVDTVTLALIPLPVAAFSPPTSTLSYPFYLYRLG